MNELLLFQILALAFSVILVLGTIYSIRLYLEICVRDPGCRL